MNSIYYNPYNKHRHFNQNIKNNPFKNGLSRKNSGYHKSDKTESTHCRSIRKIESTKEKAITNQYTKTQPNIRDQSQYTYSKIYCLNQRKYPKSDSLGKNLDKRRKAYLIDQIQTNNKEQQQSSIAYFPRNVQNNSQLLQHFANISTITHKSVVNPDNIAFNDNDSVQNNNESIGLNLSNTYSRSQQSINNYNTQYLSIQPYKQIFLCKLCYQYFYQVEIKSHLNYCISIIPNQQKKRIYQQKWDKLIILLNLLNVKYQVIQLKVIASLMKSLSHQTNANKRLNHRILNFPMKINAKKSSQKLDQIIWVIQKLQNQTILNKEQLKYVIENLWNKIRF